MYIGDFSARIDGMMEWWNGDSTNLQGTELAELAAQYSLKQIIDGPTHILPNSASCIDLIFTNYLLRSSSFAISEMSSPINFYKSVFRYFFSFSLWAENLGFL